MSTWREYFKAAVLETDWRRIGDRIDKAESEIKEQLHLLPPGATQLPELFAALNSLKSLHVEVASWPSRESQIASAQNGASSAPEHPPPPLTDY